MARIKYSSSFLNIVSLFKKVKAKDILDGTASEIKPYLTKNSIVMSEVQSTVDIASTANDGFVAKTIEVKILKGQLNKKYNPKMKFFHLGSQAIKIILDNDFSEANSWGINIEAGGEITYSKDRNVNCDQIKVMLDKHFACPAGTSLLQPFENKSDFDFTAILADLSATKAINDDYEQAKKDRKAFRGTRDFNIKKVDKILKGIGQFLKSIYIMNPASVGNWSFNIIISPKDAKLKTLSLKHSEIATIYNVTNGSDMTNKSLAIINAYKGLLCTGTPIVINPLEKIIVPKKWGTTTLKNMSDSIIGEITYLGK